MIADREELEVCFCVEDERELLLPDREELEECVLLEGELNVLERCVEVVNERVDVRREDEDDKTTLTETEREVDVVRVFSEVELGVERST